MNRFSLLLSIFLLFLFGLNVIGQNESDLPEQFIVVLGIVQDADYPQAACVKDCCKIEGPKKSAIFIPDIDKWNQWNKDIVNEIEKVDFAFLDGTFYKNGELPNRDMSQIPHPFIEESIQTFSKMNQEEKSKIFFIHFNHINPLLKSDAQELKELKEKGLNIAIEKQIFGI